MSAHRFFLTDQIAEGSDQPLPLTPEDRHHAVDVLRVRVGELIDVVAPGGRAWRVRVTGVREDAVCATPVEELVTPPQSRVALFQGVAKGDRMDDIVRQAVEIGAEEIVPVLSVRTVVRLDANKRRERGERWRRVALAAAKQAKRTSVPHVSDPVRLRDAVAGLASFDGAVVLWEEAEGESLAHAVRACAASKEARIAVIVGPEGGFAAEEVEAFSAAGARVATLGPYILRTETAALVALTLAIGALGGLGDGGE